MNEADIRAFQAKPSHDWEGKPLKVDGNLGPRTQWALGIAALDPRRQAIVANACGFVGLTERGTNRGPEIDTWLTRCGAPLGSAWCAAFASWCISVTGRTGIKQAGAQALGRFLRATTRPLPGDLMWFPTGDWTGHCGIVIGTGLEVVATVEGNQNNAVRLVMRERRHVRFGITVDSDATDEVSVPPGLTLIPVQHEGTR